MGIEIIKDPSLRKNWKNFIDVAHAKLSDKQIDLFFTMFKNDGLWTFVYLLKVIKFRLIS